MDINTAAPVITRDEILVHAPIETIWDIQTDVADWRGSLRNWLANLKRTAEGDARSATSR
jgi:hypothetical protein